MNTTVIFDLETVPDLDALARVQGRHPIDVYGAREQLGDDFPKAPFHRIVAAGFCALRPCERGYDCIWLGSFLAGRFDERDLVGKTLEILNRAGTLVTFNGTGFDLPVLRYRAMVHRLAAPALNERRVFHRFGTAHIDLCDHLSSFGFGAKARLDDIAKTLDLPGKPAGVDGGAVEALVNEERFAELAAYVEADCVATAQIFLRYELFNGRVAFEDHAWSVARLDECLAQRLRRPPLQLVKSEHHPEC